MPSLEKYPELMTKEEVAAVLGCAPSMVARIKGLPKTPVGNGKGLLRYRKEDVISYINSKTERKEVGTNGNKQAEGHRKVGVSSLLGWEELQKA